MKKIFIILGLLAINVPAYALTKRDIKSVCTELAEKEASKNKNADLKIQKMAEDACVCVGLEMPGSVTKNKFKQLLESNDESIKSISETCLMQVMFSMPEMQLLMLSNF